mmetsp:Transcript_34112/g.57315  ORF Transcript_34112/g.57315 Transcript_34112/m.57315 type:complete len:344 (+) Transcript_34112:781-1812(+)
MDRILQGCVAIGGWRPLDGGGNRSDRSSAIDLTARHQSHSAHVHIARCVTQPRRQTHHVRLLHLLVLGVHVVLALKGLHDHRQEQRQQDVVPQDDPDHKVDGREPVRGEDHAHHYLVPVLQSQRLEDQHVRLEDVGEVSAGAGQAAELAEDMQSDDGKDGEEEEEKQPDGREGRRRGQQHAHDLRQRGHVLEELEHAQHSEAPERRERHPPTSRGHELEEADHDDDEVEGVEAVLEVEAPSVPDHLEEELKGEGACQQVVGPIEEGCQGRAHVVMVHRQAQCVHHDSHQEERAEFIRLHDLVAEPDERVLLGNQGGILVLARRADLELLAQPLPPSNLRSARR